MTEAHMLKKLKEGLNILRRNIQVIKKAHIKIQEVKILVSVIKSSLDEINVGKINMEYKRT